MHESQPFHIRGRGSSLHPPNRFERIQLDDDWEQLEDDEDFTGRSNKVPTEYYVDNAKSVVNENDSPDIPFRYSLNAYRGCSHGCSYFAIPLSAGFDSKTKE